MKILTIAVVASVFLTSCINFHPNGGNTGGGVDNVTGGVSFGNVEGNSRLRHEKRETNEEGWEYPSLGKEDSSGVVNEDPLDDSLMINSPHLKFKNVPIDGPLDKFVERMRRVGFVVKEKSNGQAVLSGDFADFKACEVYVETLNGKDLVSKISVCFPRQERWEIFYGDYSHLKELLTEKYGKPASCVEKFIDPYGLVPKSDTERMHYVVFDKCKYETRFATDKGEIILSIDYKDKLHAFAKLMYKDKINGGIIESYAIDDL